jgi:acetylornithine deacetylase/succinyl-diaminopimelate desuccinylase-like protein
LIPKESLREAKKELIDVLEEQRKRGIAMELKILQEGESSATDPKTPLAAALRQSIMEVMTKEPYFELCPGLCEVRYFNSRKIPAFACGPGILELAHGKEEYVPISNILNCVEIYARTGVQLLI